MPMRPRSITYMAPKEAVKRGLRGMRLPLRLVAVVCRLARRLKSRTVPSVSKKSLSYSASSQPKLPLRMRFRLSSIARKSSSTPYDLADGAFFVVGSPPSVAPICESVQSYQNPAMFTVSRLSKKLFLIPASTARISSCLKELSSAKLKPPAREPVPTLTQSKLSSVASHSTPTFQVPASQLSR